MQQGMVGLQNQAQNPNFPQQRQQNQQWSTANVNLLEHGDNCTHHKIEQELPVYHQFVLFCVSFIVVNDSNVKLIAIFFVVNWCRCITIGEMQAKSSLAHSALCLSHISVCYVYLFCWNRLTCVPVVRLHTGKTGTVTVSRGYLQITIQFSDWWSLSSTARIGSPMSLMQSLLQERPEGADHALG
jgi:hypothetical protein